MRMCNAKLPCPILPRIPIKYMDMYPCILTNICLEAKSPRPRPIASIDSLAAMVMLTASAHPLGLRRCGAKQRPRTKQKLACLRSSMLLTQNSAKAGHNEVSLNVVGLRLFANFN